MDYVFLDSGHGQKLERFGEVTLIRPSPVSVWSPRLPEEEWQKAHGYYAREAQWTLKHPILPSWFVEVEGIRLMLKLSTGGQVGLFPEQASVWRWIRDKIDTNPSNPPRVLNLFAYSGGATLAAALAGASVCHLDSAKTMVQWAKENAALNGIQEAPIRWIVDDVRKYLKRALRRKERYDAILLDPPSFGRGASGEVFKIENDLPGLLADCRDLLSDTPLFFLLSCHTPGYTPSFLQQLLETYLPKGKVERNELVLGDLPSGALAKWVP